MTSSSASPVRRLGRAALAGACAFSAIAVAVAGAPGPATAATTPAASTPPAPATFSVTSFDGTTITGDYFTAPAVAGGHRAPTVLFGPGWGGAAYDDPTMPTSTAGGTIGVAPLLAAGYNVVSWNPRGFHTSTGRAEADSALYEGRDASAIVSWVAQRSWAQLDHPGDPRVGMVGGSYGGEVQWAAAAVDHRIDAIAPDISWNSLVTSLDPNNTAKTGWDTLLYGGAQLAGQRDDPLIDAAFAGGLTSFRATPADLTFLGATGRHDLAARVKTPALILQGTVDTLFPLDEGAANYAELARNHVPVKEVWFCGGHGACLTSPGDTSVIQRDTLAWLAHYLKRQSVSTGPGFEWVDQTGSWHSAPTLRTRRTAGGVRATGSGTLALVKAGGSGPYTGPGAAQLGPEAIVVATPATNAVDVPIHFARATSVLGAPRLSLTYSGRAPRADARVLAQIVDDRTRVVLGSQITPIPVTLDGKRHQVSLPLEYLAATARAGSAFTLQLVADSSQLKAYPAGGSITFSHIHIALPTKAARR